MDKERKEEFEELVDPDSIRTPTLCAQCGPYVEVDEDGCCALCGGLATGEGVDAMFDKLSKHMARNAKLLIDWHAAASEVNVLELALRNSCVDGIHLDARMTMARKEVEGE